VTTYWQPHQVEQLRAIGLRLQQERERQNIILEDVSAKTRIRVALLQGIEAAEINRLPEPVYVRGFIRRFEETLGLPSGELSSQLVLEPTILGNVDPLMTYPPTPALAADQPSTKSKKDLKKDSPKEPQKLPAPTFRPAQAPLAEPVSAKAAPPLLEPLPEVPVASLPLFPSAVDSPPIDVRPPANPIQAKPVELKPVEQPKSVPVKSAEIKPAEIKPIGLAPVAAAPIVPSDPWAEESGLVVADRVADRPDSRSDIRIVPPPSRDLSQARDVPPSRELAVSSSDRPAAAALLPMPQAPKFDEPAPLPWRPIVLGIALFGFLGALAWGAMNLGKSPTIATQQVPAAQVKPVAPIAPPVKPQPTKPLAPVSLKVDFKDAAWIQVETDGKLAYEGEIPKGGQKTWTAQKGIFFRTGLASVVWVSVNGAPAKQFNSFPGPKDETFLQTSR
jgi:cytoskeleton protein RodZ